MADVRLVQIGPPGLDTAEKLYLTRDENGERLLPAPTGAALQQYLQDLAADADGAPPSPRTTTVNTQAVNSDNINADSRVNPLTITAPADGSPFTVRMPEGLIIGLVTIAGNGRTIDGLRRSPALIRGFALSFRSVAATWVYDAAYIYGSVA